MGQWKKRIAMIAAAGVLAASSLTGCGSLDNDAVVATVDGQEILLGVANFYARMQQAQYESYYASMMGMTGEEMWAQEVSEGETYETSVKDSTMEALEEMYLLWQHREEFDISLTEEDEQKIAEAAAKFEEANEKADIKTVSGQQKYVEEYLKLVTVATRMRTAVEEKDLDENVTDEEAAQKAMSYVSFSYSTTDENGESTDMTDEEKAEVKKNAEDFLEDLKVDEAKDIDAVAEAAGLEVQTATFDAETTYPAEELIKAADALKAEGDVTDVIETDTGCYVAKLTSLLDREATDAEKESIVAQRKQDNYDKQLEAWKEGKEIQVNENVWKKVKFEKQGVVFKEPEEDEDTTGDTTEDSAEDTTEDTADSSEDTADDDAGEDGTEDGSAEE